MATQGLALGEERIGPDENAKIDRIVEIMLSAVDASARPVKRGQHPKHHGCVTASFVIEDGIPAHLRAGVFSAPMTFNALIRFSNGREPDDRKADAHGMAIKLLGVPGKKLIEELSGETTQDFVLLDHEVFFSSDLDEFTAFSRDAIAAKNGGLAKIAFLAKMALWRRPLLKRVKAFASQTPTSPLASHYWSTTPYRLGSQAVKYMAVSPLAGELNGKGVSGVDGLSDALKAHLAEREACFGFGVHVQTDPAAHPVEDETVNWSENGAPFVKLATIVIPRQAVDPKGELAEHLAFSPWHGLEAHRPLGPINRARRAIYRQLVNRRHCLNGVTPAGSSEVPTDRQRQAAAS